MKPKFQHDCERCTFLGYFYGYDVYKCDTRIVARCGADSSEVYSQLMQSIVDNFETETWATLQVDRAMMAAITCCYLNRVPRFQLIAEELEKIA